MGQAYVHELLADKTALLFQMQSYAACSDPVIQARVRACYGALVKEVTRLSGAAARATSGSSSRTGCCSTSSRRSTSRRSPTSEPWAQRLVRRRSS